MQYDFSNVIISAVDVAQRIDSIRKENGLNQEQFAVLLNISQPAVSKYLRDRIPPAEILLRLARFGNTTIEWLLTGQKNYFFRDKINKVQESEDMYGHDNDLQLATKISALPAKGRQIVTELIEYMTD